jgi:dynein heavy chain, axonemal
VRLHHAHTCAQLGEKHLLVFGGVDKRVRLNDLWLYSTEDRTWTLVQAEGPTPEPRAHFSANQVGDRVLVFGGYGGCGAVFADLWELQIQLPAAARGASSCAGPRAVWTELTNRASGTPPAARFDHAAYVCPTAPNSDACDRLVIMGGRDLSSALRDVFVLDLTAMVWLPGAAALPGEVCNSVCDDVPSVPHHKVFSFGGKRGMMAYSNAIDVLDCGSGVRSTPPLDTGTPPVARCGRALLQSRGS